MSISTLYYIGLDGDGQLNVDAARYVGVVALSGKGNLTL